MTDDGLDPKQMAILEAAWDSFAAYGFRKTSMDDIAKGAGMSRPALYLHYRNKDDIMRTLVQAFYDQAIEGATNALAGEGSVASVLHKALVAQGGGRVEAMLNSPHGMDFLESRTEIAADLVDAGEHKLRNIYADWLAKLAADKRIHLPKTPMHLAETLSYAVSGLQKSGLTAKEYGIRLETLAILIGKGLTSGVE